MNHDNTGNDTEISGTTGATRNNSDDDTTFIAL